MDDTGRLDDVHEDMRDAVIYSLYRHMAAAIIEQAMSTDRLGINLMVEQGHRVPDYLSSPEV